MTSDGRHGDDTEHTDRKKSLRELPGVWWEMVRDEWTDRTTAGRLLFPIWLLYGAFSWAIFFTVWVALLLASGLINADRHASTAYNRLVYGDLDDE